MLAPSLTTSSLRPSWEAKARPAWVWGEGGGPGLSHRPGHLAAGARAIRPKPLPPRVLLGSRPRALLPFGDLRIPLSPQSANFRARGAKGRADHKRQAPGSRGASRQERAPVAPGGAPPSRGPPAPSPRPPRPQNLPRCARRQAGVPRPTLGPAGAGRGAEGSGDHTPARRPRSARPRAALGLGRGRGGARRGPGAPSGPSPRARRPPLSIPALGGPRPYLWARRCRLRRGLRSGEPPPGRAQRRPATAGWPAGPLLMARGARSPAAAATAAPSSECSSRAGSRDAANAPAPQPSSPPPPGRGRSRLQRRPAPPGKRPPAPPSARPRGRRPPAPRPQPAVTQAAAGPRTSSPAETTPRAAGRRGLPPGRGSGAAGAARPGPSGFRAAHLAAWAGGPPGRHLPRPNEARKTRGFPAPGIRSATAAPPPGK